jgi:hypothetical protein
LAIFVDFSATFAVKALRTLRESSLRPLRLKSFALDEVYQPLWLKLFQDGRDHTRIASNLRPQPCQCSNAVPYDKTTGSFAALLSLGTFASAADKPKITIDEFFNYVRLTP